MAAHGAAPRSGSRVSCFSLHRPPFVVFGMGWRSATPSANAWRAGGDVKFRRIAEDAMRHIVTPQVARAYTVAPTLPADAEIGAAY
jgi:hypothetical protein